MKLSKDQILGLNNTIRSLRDKYQALEDKNKAIKDELNSLKEKILYSKYSNLIGKPYQLSDSFNKLFLLKGFEKGDRLKGITIEYNLQNKKIIKVDLESSWLTIDRLSKHVETELWNELTEDLFKELQVK